MRSNQPLFSPLSRWTALGDLDGLDSVLDPVEAHARGFGGLDFGALVGKSLCCGVVGDKACGTVLVVAEFEEYLCDGKEGEEGTSFSCWGRCHDAAHDTALTVNGAVWCWVIHGFVLFFNLSTRRDYSYTKAKGGV
jgi:hypothetical protein